MIKSEEQNYQDCINAERYDPVPPVLAVEDFNVSNFFCLSNLLLFFLWGPILLNRSKIVNLLFFWHNFKDLSLEVPHNNMVYSHEHHKDLISHIGFIRASLRKQSVQLEWDESLAKVE